METPTIRKCINCEENPARPDSNWCSHICFEMWYNLEQAKLLVFVLDQLLDETFGVKDANTRIS
jgi:hypothetical protein